jgi:hypothetical protein
LFLAKTSAMRISIPLHLSYRSFIPLPRFIRSRRPTTLLAPSLVLFPPRSICLRGTCWVFLLVLHFLFCSSVLAWHFSFPPRLSPFFILLQINTRSVCRQLQCWWCDPATSIPPVTYTRCIGYRNPTWHITTSVRLMHLSVSDTRVTSSTSPLPSPLDTTFPRSTWCVRGFNHLFLKQQKHCTLFPGETLNEFSRDQNE